MTNQTLTPLERDKSRFLINLPPLSEEGKEWAKQYITDKRTVICAHQPNKSIHIYS